MSISEMSANQREKPLWNWLAVGLHIFNHFANQIHHTTQRIWFVRRQIRQTRKFIARCDVLFIFGRPG